MSYQIWKTQAGIPDVSGFMDLFSNRCAYIKVENFLSDQECEILVKILRGMGFKQYDYNFEHDEAPPAANLFDSHYLYEQKSPEEYFPKAQIANASYQELVNEAHFNPVQKVLDFLAKHSQMPVNIAEQDGQQYTYVIARELNNSAMLHADFAPFIPDYWSISKITAEFAWNIYLTDPGEGGDCVVYNKPWEKEDDQYIVGNTYGYDHKLVSGREFVNIRPKPGTLLFFNSRNFHEVLKSQYQRLSLGGHIGLLPSKRCIAWV